ncbi:MAG: DUF3857 domain-containing protein [Deltaproteobacteria bacterium]|nr:DUF3857 domain-containing protein [Deltaproteobacteria bacterium]
MRDARKPRWAIPFARLVQHFGDTAPSVTFGAVEQLSRNRRLPPGRRAFIDAMRARLLVRMGRLDEARRVVSDLGYVTRWQMVGPFDNEGKQGFDREDAPEAARREAFDANAHYQGKEREVGWRLNPAEAWNGYNSFDAIFRPFSSVCGYAETSVQSEREQPLSLWLGGGGATKVYWNGELVLTDSAYRSPDPDRQVVLVPARQGANRLLVKSCVVSTGWGFYLRVGDARGAPARGITVDPAQIRPVTGEAPSLRMPRPPVPALAGLEAAAEGDDASPAALEDLARFLLISGADDVAEHRARQLAARAADAEPTLRRLRLAASLAAQRGDVMRFAAKARELFPNEPESLLFQADVVAAGMTPDDALPILDRIRDRGRFGVEATLLRVQILQNLDLHETARSLVESLAPRTAGAHQFLRDRANAARIAGRQDRYLVLLREALAARYDDIGARKALLGDALRRGELEPVREQLAVLRALLPTNQPTLRYVAAIYEALGSRDDALDVLRHGTEIAPDAAPTRVATGRLLLRMNQQAAAGEALRAALAVRPQDAETRELLEQIQPQERPDERWAVEAAALLARRTEDTSFPITTLEDLTVNTVYENGLGSSFRQVVMQVHDAEGARRMRVYGISFDPSSQRVDVRLARVYRGDRRLEAVRYYEQSTGDARYRIYYDTRQFVVVFPDLQPGDVLELRWRVDDISHRNLFADYYGDFHFLQSFQPIKRSDYVLITPEQRHFYFNDPSLAGLSHEQSTQDGKRTDHFFADNIPALRSEPGMPGLSEIAPYLHVSTYRTWEEVGHWYWGLIEDQLNLDDDLRRTVHELVDDAPDLATKVQRIHNWVVKNTHYVGLEFGIHGYKPYRVTDIVRRGFGDCKDKASVMYAMYREAGIDAHIVLLRTRRNGAITDLPASLAVFDHAITYVPALDLYLDGTAEHSGTTELPQGDQGVTVLHVWPEGAELRRTPVLPPDQNFRRRRMEVRLEGDGAATLSVNERVIGAGAQRYRSTYAAQGTRGERFERALRALFPGLTLEEQSFPHLEDLERPVEYSYRARVPQMARRDGTNLRLSPSVMTDLLRGMAAQPTRRLPLDLGGTSRYVEERTIRLPAGFRPGRLPTGGVAESPFGKLSLSVEANGRSILARTEFEVRRDRIPPDEYPAFRAWVERADALLREQITLEGGPR